jgi:spore germination cell wall hydrolase CwlJ-like protein
MLGLECLAVAVFFEARDQPLTGQYAVAEVVMNRVMDPRWPDTICGVVFQDKQFSFTHDGKSDKMEKYAHNDEIEWRAMNQARTVAKEIYDSGYVELEATHYHALSVRPSWAKHYEKVGRIGDHVFYIAPKGK